MKQTGSHGSESNTYVNALKFSQKREEKGIKMPRKQTAKQRVSSGSGKSKGSVDTDVADVHLNGEEDESVPIYDTCDELREKLVAHLRGEGATQAATARAIAAQFPGDIKVSVGQLQTFLGGKGPRKGGDSRVFHGGYVPMEKLRIENKKPKTRFRQEMEAQWPEGFSREPYRAWTFRVGERVFEDKHGKISIS